MVALRDYWQVGSHEKTELRATAIPAPTTAIRLPVFWKCCQCGSPLELDIFEWTVADGIPTSGGYHVLCSGNDLHDPLDDFEADNHAIYAWIYEYVRVNVQRDLWQVN